MRSRLCFDNINNLVANYEKTGDHATDSEINAFLKECGFGVKKEENGVTTYLFTKSADPKLIINTIEWTITKFNEVLGPDGFEICEKLQKSKTKADNRKENFLKAKQRGLEIKNKTESDLTIVTEGPYKFIRDLYPYQKKSVEHILAMENAANFSVPGSGKTSIAYAAISKWLDDGIVKKILVIGPKASFVPWEEEFKHCFGRKPRKFRVSGSKDAKNLPDLGPSYDLFLMHYATAMGNISEINDFLENNPTVLIIDESHNIKNPNNGRWATDAQKYGINAKRRIILSGTPMPNDAKDLWTQFAFLWPFDNPLGNQIPYNDYVGARGIGKYKPDLDPLYERIKKSDLGLPKPKFFNHRVELRPIQRKIYDLIAAKTLKEIAEADYKDQARMQKFRTAKMVRLLQAASNPSMLDEKSTKFLVDSEQFGIRKEELDVREKEENISEIFDTSFYDKVKNYSTYEIPEKLVKAERIAQDLMEQKEKVIIWCSFKLNMYVFEDKSNHLFDDQKPILINGDISDDPDDPDGRDERIKKFKEDANPRVLIATAASLGESVSLHQHLGKKVCSNAIYLDRNFNGAQFMQSMDRIHRIGMLPETVVNYHLIVAKNTIDEKIHQRLWEKNQDMHSALNSNDLEPLDYDGNVIEPNEKQSDKDYNALVEHLKGNDDPELKNYNVS